MSQDEYKEDIIVWQKWFDPLGGDDIESHEDVLEPEFYEEEYEQETNEEQTQPEFYTRPTKVIMTPMGIIPYTDNTASNKIFNFWVGHTNFDITPYIAAIIEQTKGIECLDIFTRYRFRIAVGKLFDAKTVMLDINDRVYDFLLRNK